MYDWAYRSGDRSARKHNGPALDRLSACTLAGNCGPGEHTVVIIGSFHFGELCLILCVSGADGVGNSLAGHVGGENIW